MVGANVGGRNGAGGRGGGGGGGGGAGPGAVGTSTRGAVVGRGGVPVKNVGLVTKFDGVLGPDAGSMTKRLSGLAELNRKSNGVDPDFSGFGVVNFSSSPLPSVFPKMSPPFAVIALISDGALGSPEKNTPLVSTAFKF